MCRGLLERSLGPVELTSSSGPSYLITDSVAFPSVGLLVRSDEPSRMALRDANPGNWTNAEWQQLFDGVLGPWVMATHDGEVIAICHTPARAG